MSERAADTDQQTVPLSGRVVLTRVEALRDEFRKLKGGAIELDLSEVEAMDTAGAWLIVELQARIEAEGGSFRIVGASTSSSDLIEVVQESLPEKEPAEKLGNPLINWVASVGETTWFWLTSLVEIVNFLGAVVRRFGIVALHPSRLRITSVVHHMQEIGLKAIPIVSLMAFLIGVVMAFQGAVQLRQFGAEVFVVDLIAISILRELGILLTAIIVAGRSGAAFTAAIGSMKMREEIDALRTLSLDPIEILVLPRVLALVIVLPLLGVVADVMGIFGGAVMSWIELGVTPGMFQTRLHESIDVWHYAVGVIKAPFFALIIGVVGCFQGMQVGGNVDSLGRLTSASVVLAIFLVIVADALFSVFFSIVGV